MNLKSIRRRQYLPLSQSVMYNQTYETIIILFLLLSFCVIISVVKYLKAKPTAALVN